MTAVVAGKGGGEVLGGMKVKYRERESVKLVRVLCCYPDPQGRFVVYSFLKKIFLIIIIRIVRGVVG